MRGEGLLARLVLVVAALAHPLVGMAACTAHSGPKTTALIELYTSEGCSSCPPADRLLASFSQGVGRGTDAVALALHVNYWDAIGWKDPYAQGAFSDRHDWLVHANHHTVAYTPHFFVNGNEMSSGGGQLRSAVLEVNAQPASARITLNSAGTTAGRLSLDAVAQTDEGVGPAALFVAVAESGLVSNVARGENRGARLTHDHVVRSWIGPISLADKEVRYHRDLELPAGVDRSHIEVIAFVQDQRSGKILQTIAVAPCVSVDAAMAGLRAPTSN